MLSLIIDRDWLWALSAEIAEDNAPVRLMVKLRENQDEKSRRDAEDVGGADGDTVHRERRRGRRGVDAGHRAGDGRVVEDRVAGGVRRGHRDGVLAAVRQLVAAGILAVPGEAVGAGIAGAGPGVDDVAGRIRDADRD